MIDDIRHIAAEAGDAIMNTYDDPAQVETKEDDSPLTQADRAAHNCIVAALTALTPDIPVLSEESENISTEERMGWDRFWLVDPLDGTKEFIKKTGQFTVNIALIENGESTLGVVLAPASNLEYFASRGNGAFKQLGQAEPEKIQVSEIDKNKLRIVASRDHAGPKVTAMLEKLTNAKLVSMGSSLKFCLVAEGAADLYPRFVTTMEWDTGAAQCILEEAGGAVCTLDGYRLAYGKEDPHNPSIIAAGHPTLDWKALLPKD
ncbi:MAG: 3'(2'),5'-bisphosphate nucleotidase CysQ [Verrucomicrobiota bacterium]|jgi:3'(2'), 5'-bisphosphate nucleotidase|nr:3'(2'),5'-bisphosphate nucleotidase CysQ [Verrucomicrobiota bacterium]MDP7050900.1 3'(2'),5'-bisphosphate nucleotidase CysQ [Verrucomicrobiota bacterium]